MEEMYYIKKEILKEDGRVWLKTLSHNMDWEGKIRGQLLINFCERNVPYHRQYIV